MRVIDRIKKARKDARRSIEVPEWDEKLFFTPLTINDMQAVQDRMRDDGKDPERHDQEKRVTLLIQKAELEDGTKAFEFGDRVEFMENAEWAVTQRVIAFMYSSSFSIAASEAEAKKKSERTEDSSGDS